MKDKMLTHPELYEESLRLEDLIDEYKDKKDFVNLEKALLEILLIYEGLNYCEEDEYLENMNDVYFNLLNIYFTSRNKNGIIWCLDKLLGNYDLLIQRDIGDNYLISKHVNALNKVMGKYNDYLKDINIFQEYPRLKKYIKE